MTYSFVLDGETVWHPANTVGALYVRMALAAATLLGVPAGLTDVYGNGDDGDTFDIDPVAYPAFVRAGLARYAASHHPDLRLLLGSVVAVSLQLLRQADITIGPADEAERVALDELRELVM